MTEAVDALFDSIQKRPRPEDVAELLLELFPGAFGASERLLLDRAARESLKRSTYAYSSMAADFTQVVGADRLVATSARLFSIRDPPSAEDCLDAARVRAFLERVAVTIHASVADLDFRNGRLNRDQRKALGVAVRKRAYNRRFRTLRRLEARIEAIVRNQEKYFASRVAKSAGATFLTREELARDLPTACFVAYLSARMNLRSVFTNQSQTRAFDEIASALLARAERGNPNWYAIALVHPERNVLARLSDEARGRLLGVWTEALRRLAELLATLYEENRFDLATMIVRRGNDSSSWNAAAGAWNRARASWISLVYSLGMESVLEGYCPGKVMRLMAADVARWHAASKGGEGSSLDANTFVWRELPLPWEVFRGRAECRLSTVSDACMRHGVKLEGWVEPPPAKRAVEFSPTPELVHGVAVSSPFLAERLRALGWFSGKPVVWNREHPPVHVERDGHGSVLTVHEAPGIDGQRGPGAT
jgi:hypothetical protein